MSNSYDVLVTGGNGQLGKAFKLLKKKYKIILLSKKKLDITKKNSTLKIITKYKPRIIINTAAYTDVVNSENNYKLAKSVNFTGVKNLTIICKKLDILLIHISTDYVFFGNKKSSYKENDKCIPKNNYGKSKLMAEKIIKNNLNKYFIIRVSWLFGYGKNNFVYKIINLLKKKQPLVVVDNEYSSPTSADDLVDIIDIIISRYNINKKLLYGLYHFNSLDRKISRYDFTILIQKIFKNKKIISSNIKKKNDISVFRPINTFLNTKKIYNEFNYKRKNFNFSLNKMIDYYLQNNIK